MLQHPNTTLRSKEYYFQDGIVWNRISMSDACFRVLSKDKLATDVGPVLYKGNYELLGFLNSKIANTLLKILNPTIHYNTGDMEKLPCIDADNYMIRDIVKNSIEISKKDWDSFETSWNFNKHPLVQAVDKLSTTNSDTNCPLEERFLFWQSECQRRFDQLKANEEELNRIFIDTYDLQEELTPGIEEKDVTVRKADLKRDISSLISYAVGCMFGRYSLDVEGLVYAGGEWDSSKYKTFIPDDDNCIPITDEEYFEDDIVGRFCEFLKVVFGEDSLEANLNYVAQALGNKGNTSREIIRNYFLNDFFKDHCSTYSVTGSGKRPIYWLFDAGKQNGFKCLIYMHRYDKDTVNRVRSEYLKKMQDAIEGALKNAEYAVDNSSSAVDRAAATRKRDKYIKQLNEIRAYYPALSHMALQRVEINLDDGVKTNYAKFQGIETVDENGKKQKVDLLAKI